MKKLILLALLSLASAGILPAADTAWPPSIRGLVEGVATIRTDDFLRVPASVEARRAESGVAAFDVAKTAPEVELAFHDRLGPDAASRRLWSSWGDICVADDGRVYCAIGDHGDDAGGDARCFLYEWNPATKRLRQIVDMNRVVPPRAGQPAWSKVHAKIDQGADGKIYFSCTLNAGGKAGDPKYGFNDALPGGQLYRYDPAGGRTEIFANLPPRRCTATSLLDRARNVWWCNLEAGGGDALWGIHLGTEKVVHQGEDGSVGFNRAFTLLRDGRVLCNGAKNFQALDAATGKFQQTQAATDGSPGMRCATRESRSGHVFGVLQTTHQLFDYTVAGDALKLLGPGWLAGEYTAVCELSPDERFLYYLPGSHGGAWKSGTPVIQYEIATGRRKVLAFLAPAIEGRTDSVPAGTYGMKLSADGSTIFVNFNGHPADRIRPSGMKANGFGLTAFAAIHIPPSER